MENVPPPGLRLRPCAEAACGGGLPRIAPTMVHTVGAPIGEQIDMVWGHGATLTHEDLATKYGLRWPGLPTCSY